MTLLHVRPFVSKPQYFTVLFVGRFPLVTHRRSAGPCSPIAPRASTRTVPPHAAQWTRVPAGTRAPPPTLCRFFMTASGSALAYIDQKSRTPSGEAPLRSPDSIPSPQRSLAPVEVASG